MTERRQCGKILSDMTKSKYDSNAEDPDKKDSKSGWNSYSKSQKIGSIVMSAIAGASGLLVAGSTVALGVHGLQQLSAEQKKGEASTESNRKAAIDLVQQHGVLLADGTEQDIPKLSLSDSLKKFLKGDYSVEGSVVTEHDVPMSKNIDGQTYVNIPLPTDLSKQETPPNAGFAILPLGSNGSLTPVVVGNGSSGEASQGLNFQLSDYGDPSKLAKQVHIGTGDDLGNTKASLFIDKNEQGDAAYWLHINSDNQSAADGSFITAVLTS